MEGFLLEIKRLRTYFYVPNGVVRAVDGVDLRIAEGETVALVGESGSGKSATALSILRLVDEPGRVVSGEVIFKGRDLLKLGEAEMRKIRGRQISIIFQEPRAALNPVLTIGDQIAETVQAHLKASRKEALKVAADMLAAVRMPELALRSYPHQLSGGMCQRAMIAMALCCKPSLLIADEPTTALDVTVRAEILELLRKLKARFGLSLLLITHDLGVAAKIADRMAVMYAGKIVEDAPTVTLLEAPKHPYTCALLDAIPRWLDDSSGQGKLKSIAGSPPSLLDPPAHCRFAQRCPDVMQACTQHAPALQQIARAHSVRCFKYGDIREGEDATQGR